MLHSKKLKAMLAVSALTLSAFALSPTFNIDAATVNGHGAIQIADAGRHVKISMWYDSDTDEYVSSFGTRVKASEWKDAQIDKNNAAIEKERANATQAMEDQKTAREEADAKLNAKADTLSDDNFVHYDSNDKDSLSFIGDNGTTVSNVANGSVAEGSSDAMNVGQVNSVRKTLDAETEARKQALANEAQDRKNADDEISAKIGTADDISSDNYIDKNANISDNLLTLDKTAYDQANAIDKQREQTEKRVSEEAKKRQEADNALADRIGSIKEGAKLDYIDADGTVADNLKKLDQATKDLEDSYNSTFDAFDDLTEQVKSDRERADKEISDKIGTISSSENITYIERDASVSDNLTALDKATKDNADAIEKEIQDRKDAVSDVSSQMDASIADLMNENTNVGAGSAALAGLSYLPYETNQRINVAAAVGHYGNKNAAALGAKYNFNEDASLNVATTVGDGHNIVSYGVSLKVGPSSTYARKVKKAQMDKAMKASREALSDARAQNKWLSAEAAYYGDMRRELPRRFRMAKLIDDRLRHGEKIDKELILEYADELKYIRAHGGLR